MQENIFPHCDNQILSMLTDSEVELNHFEHARGDQIVITPCEVKGQYLLTLQLIRYCILSLQSSTVISECSLGLA